MTSDSSRHLPPGCHLPRRADRRRSHLLKGLPPAGGPGLVLNERRRVNGERRRAANASNRPLPCALLRSPDPPAGGALAGIGSWLRRRLGYPWRGRMKLPRFMGRESREAR